METDVFNPAVGRLNLGEATAAVGRPAAGFAAVVGRPAAGFAAAVGRPAAGLAAAVVGWLSTGEAARVGALGETLANPSLAMVANCVDCRPVGKANTALLFTVGNLSIRF